MRSESEVLVEEGLVTIAEAMRFIGLRHSTLYKLMNAGQLEYCKLGKSRRIPRRALVNLASRNLVGRDAE